jgi:hypothetical protein
MLTRSPDIALAFLNLILPERGFYIASIKNPRGKGFLPNRFAATPEALWAILEEADRDGYESYHACASFKEERNDPRGTPAGQKRFGRTKHNVLGVKSFWLDIDVGPEKGYSDQGAATDALRTFCAKLHLPPPIIVSSGSGLHVYWPLQQMLDRATWERYARGLKTLCVRDGLHVDPTRTADTSSVLRTPGTHNRKHGLEREVELDPKFLDMFPDAQGYALEQFKVFAEHTEAPRGAPKGQHDEDADRARFDPHGLLEAEKLKDHSYLAAPNRRQIGAAALSGFAELDDDYPPSSGELVAEKCEQVRALRDSEGKVEEPLWYAALGVLAFCADGDELAHKWSSGDVDRYTEQETQERLDRARALSGATTCQHFHDKIDATVCERCPHWGIINSPIALGRLEDQPTPSGQVSLQWDYTQAGDLRLKSYVNTRLLLMQLNIRCRHDVFHDRKIIEGGGDAVEKQGPQLSDAMIRALRDEIIKQFRYDPGIEIIREAAERACEENRYDPIVDYLAALRWDRQPRLDRWLITYCGAEDTPLNRAFGRTTLIAAVRRTRQPGCKFDHMLILEGPQRAGKSSVCYILAGGADNFSDLPILHENSQKQQEQLAGRWFYEIAELVDMKRMDIEALKGFLSRTNDRGRNAYGRFVKDQLRRGIFIGTTNDAEYLRDPSGGSRFWPVKIGSIDLDALAPNRDQIFAEAAHYEAQGESLIIPQELWSVAAVAQEARLMKDPWEDRLVNVRGEIINEGEGWIERISTTDLFTYPYLDLPVIHQTDFNAKRAAIAMRKNGWQGPKVMRFKNTKPTLDDPDGKKTIPRRGFWRPASEPPKAQAPPLADANERLKDVFKLPTLK